MVPHVARVRVERRRPHRVLDGLQPIGEVVGDGLVRRLDVLAAVELREQIDPSTLGLALRVVPGVPLLPTLPSGWIRVELDLDVPASSLLHHRAAHGYSSGSGRPSASTHVDRVEIGNDRPVVESPAARYADASVDRAGCTSRSPSASSSNASSGLRSRSVSHAERRHLDEFDEQLRHPGDDLVLGATRRASDSVCTACRRRSSCCLPPSARMSEPKASCSAVCISSGSVEVSSLIRARNESQPVGSTHHQGRQIGAAEFGSNLSPSIGSTVDRPRCQAAGGRTSRSAARSNERRRPPRWTSMLRRRSTVERLLDRRHTGLIERHAEKRFE